MSGEKSSFGSFEELRRALGGGEPEPEEEGPDSVGAEAELPDLRPGLREVLASAGEAFGPMDTGPPCYRDLESEEMELLASFRVRTVFPDEVLEEVRHLPEDPDPADFAGREDLRGERIFTIDGEDARDFDDAIAIKALEGGYEVGVHIADVSHYVRPETALDREAAARATSTYLPDQVIPMLPEELSNHLCSLVPHRDRFAFSVIMTFDRGGRMTESRVHKSVIRSIHRCTYKVVQELLDGVENEDTRRIAELRPDLELFASWTRQQQLIRDRKGSLRMQSAERKFLFDKDHVVEKIYPSPLYFSQTLIEETALAANQAVGSFFRDRGLPTIYRIHPRKEQEEIDAVAKALDEHGIKVPDKDNLTGRDVGRLIRLARRRPNADALISRIMGLVERAYYEVAQADESAPHWGLAREHYLHFTSPIRRYPDLIVHRWLHDVLSREDAKAALLQREQIAELCDVASHCSVRADVADMVETAIDDLKVCEYMDRYVGERLRARIQRVSPFGIEVFLAEHYVTGFIPGRTLEGRKKIEGPVLTVSSRKGTRSFKEGDAIEVTVHHVDFIRLEVVLHVADHRRGR